MKKLLLLVVIVAALFYGAAANKGIRQFVGSKPVSAEISSAAKASSPQAARTAFEERRSGIQISGEGVVSKLLSDDMDGSRHQRFILTLASGQTLMVAHNIDVAPRIESLKSGDSAACTSRGGSEMACVPAPSRRQAPSQWHSQEREQVASCPLKGFCGGCDAA